MQTLFFVEDLAYFVGIAMSCENVVLQMIKDAFMQTLFFIACITKCEKQKHLKISLHP